MQSIAEKINQNTDRRANITTDVLFEYNEALGAFTLSTSGILAYIEILNKELMAAADNG
jgi:hypothetical protein